MTIFTTTRLGFAEFRRIRLLKVRKINDDILNSFRRVKDFKNDVYGDDKGV